MSGASAGAKRVGAVGSVPFRRLLTVGEAAIELGVSARTVQRRIAAGALRAFKDGRLVRVDRLELARYVAAHTARPGPPAAVARRRTLLPSDPSDRVERLW
jgi:excisionase family DNA binding protein